MLDGLFGDHVLMLDHAGGERHARHLAHPLGPEPGAVDHDLAIDRALVGLDSRDPATASLQPRNPHAFLDPHAAGPGALRIGLGQAVGIDIAVGRDIGGTHHARRRHVWEAVLCLLM